MQIIARVQQIQALIFGTFWNSFPQQYFPPSVVADIEGQLYWISLWVTQRTKVAKGKSRNNSLRTRLIALTFQPYVFRLVSQVSWTSTTSSMKQKNNLF